MSDVAYGAVPATPVAGQDLRLRVPYQIIQDSRENITRVTVRDFWDDATSRRYRKELSATLQRRTSGKPRLLIDATDFPVQSQQVAADLRLIIDDPALPACRVAVVTVNALLQLQSRRIGPDHALFPDEASAKAWLNEE